MHRASKRHVSLPASMRQAAPSGHGRTTRTLSNSLQVQLRSRQNSSPKNLSLLGLLSHSPVTKLIHSA